MRQRAIDRMRIVHVRPDAGKTKFGMLRLTLGRVKAGSNACEVSAPMGFRLRGNDLRRED